MPNDVPDWTSVSLMTEAAIPGSPFTFARDGAIHFVNGVQLPQGCQWLMIGTATQQDIELVEVSGTTTGIGYAVNTLTGNTPLTYVRVHPAADPTVNIALQIASGAGNALVAILYGFSPTSNDLDTTTPSPVFLESDITTPIRVDAGLDLAVNLIGVSLAGAVAGQVKVGTPDWQNFARQNGAGGPASCGSGASAGKHAVLGEVVFSVAANAARTFTGRVWDGPSGGTQIGVVVIGSNGAAAGPTSLSETLRGLKSSVGNALTFDFDFAAAAGEQQGITAVGYFQ